MVCRNLIITQEIPTAKRMHTNHGTITNVIANTTINNDAVVIIAIAMTLTIKLRSLSLSPFSRENMIYVNSYAERAEAPPLSDEVRSLSFGTNIAVSEVRF